MSRNAFSNLRYGYVCTLLDLINMNQLNRITHIRRLFVEKAEGFDEVVSFLTELGMISSNDHKLSLETDWTTSDSAIRRNEILRKLLDKRNRYRTEVFRFLNRFRLVQTKMIYTSPDQSRSSESAVRNFLIDLGVVVHLLEIGKYILLPEYLSLFVSARNNANHTSPVLLEKNVKTRNEIGYAAEDLVAEYECERVGPEHADKVDHVSMRNTAAGYDIQSISIETDGQVTPRFIEVKAVSPKTFKFYWSKNEVAVARVLSNWYYLYLLPVTRGGQFNLDKLVVIPDPCNSIFQDNTNWVTETDATICYLKRAELN